MRRAALLALALAACHQAPPAADNASSGVATPAAPVTGALARYVGKYPDDRVEGQSFLEDPLVRNGVAQVVRDPAIVRLVLGPATRSPIVARDGQLVAAGCEPHNCGAHNWAVLISPDGRAPQACVKPDGGAPQWYGETPVGAAKDTCPQSG